MEKIKHNEAIKGKVVTTYNSAGGIGIGYLIDGNVYKTTGSYWAINAEKDIYPLAYYCEDGGIGYLNKLKKLS